MLLSLLPAEGIFLTNYNAPTEHLKKNIMCSGRFLMTLMETNRLKQSSIRGSIHPISGGKFTPRGGE